MKVPFPSHIKVYIFTIQEEEIRINCLQYKRKIENETKFRSKLFGMSSVPKHNKKGLRASMCLPRRHNAVAKEIYSKLLKKDTKKKKLVKTQSFGILPDKKLTRISRLSHDKLDLVIWERYSRKHFIEDVLLRLDVNIQKNKQLKIN